VRRFLATPLVSAVLGGGVTAAVLLAAGVVGDGDRTVVYQQSPLASAPRQSGAAGTSPGGGHEVLTAADIYERDAPGVAFIRARTVAAAQSPFDFGTSQGSESTGSGFVLDEDGHVLTNAHVIDHATSVTVTLSGTQTLQASIVGKDESTDLALLKVDPEGIELHPLELGTAKTLQVGDPTVAIGNPFGFDRTLTTGVVSALQRRITAPDNYTIEDVIQTDAALNPGNSGGPLIDAGGRVIGINSQIATGGSGTGSVGIGFAVPIDAAKEVVSELKAHGRVERPWLGIEFVPVDGVVQGAGVDVKSGLLIQVVKPGGPAARAGLSGGTQSVTLASGEQLLVGGDVITAVDDEAVATSSDLAEALAPHDPGDTVTVRVRRGGQERTVPVTLGNRPPGGSDS
jgi:S1-C subfamily serine protease